MKYNIQIMGADEIVYKAQSNQLDKCVVISINSPNHRTELNNENIVDILRLEFDDIEKIRERLTAMCMEDGYKIKEFVEKYKDEVETIIVHCAAGISRSAGVGCGIALYLNGDDNYIWGSGHYTPNKRCYEVTTRAFGIRVNRQSMAVKEKLKNNGHQIAQSKFQKDYGINLDDMFI